MSCSGTACLFVVGKLACARLSVLIRSKPVFVMACVRIVFVDPVPPPHQNLITLLLLFFVRRHFLQLLIYLNQTAEGDKYPTKGTLHALQLELFLWVHKFFL